MWVGSIVFVVLGEGEGARVGEGEGAHFGEGKGVQAGEGKGAQRVRVCACTLMRVRRVQW
jgi:hypothetical protein